MKKLILVLVLMMSTSAFAQEKKKNPWIAGGLNFVLSGAGYIYNGERPTLGLGLTVGALGLTYVENFAEFGDDDETLADFDSGTFGILALSVFVMNTVLAVDGYREAMQINMGGMEKMGKAKTEPKREQRMALAPTFLPSQRGGLVPGAALAITF